MEHMAWKGRIKPGCKAEHQKCHAEIWPEMDPVTGVQPKLEQVFRLN